MNDLIFRKGNIHDLDALDRLYQDCKADLLARGIQQWGDWEGGYPERGFLKGSLEKEELFLLEHSSSGIVGSVVLNQEQADIWSAISWLPHMERNLVIHALIISPDHQGKGYGKFLLQQSEKLAVERGFDSMRLDAFARYEHSNQMYQKKGYQKLGSVFFEGKPPGHQEYYCYEKVLSPTG